MEDNKKKQPNEISRDPIGERMASETYMYLSDALPSDLDTILKHAKILLDLPEEVTP